MVYNSDTALLLSTIKHEFLIDTQLISGCQSLLFRAADVSATHLVVTFTMLSIVQKLERRILGLETTWKETVIVLGGH